MFRAKREIRNTKDIVLEAIKVEKILDQNGVSDSEKSSYVAIMLAIVYREDKRIFDEVLKEIKELANTMVF
jgi:hypothetical protein